MRPELFKIPGLPITVPSYGAMVMLGILIGTWWMARKAARVKADPDLVLNLAFIALICGMLGGRLFYVLHYWSDQFADEPGRIISFRAGGFELYGGIIGAFFPCLFYVLAKGVSARLYADMVTPSIFLGLAIGRLGCFLFGCCWGGSCPDALPWAVRFPYASPPYMDQWEARQVTLPAELILIDEAGEGSPMAREILALSREQLTDKLDQVERKLKEAREDGDAAKVEQAETQHERLGYAINTLLGHFDRFGDPETLRARTQSSGMRTHPIHPTQLYASFGALLLALMTNAYFYRRKRHGMVMVVGMMCYSVQRVFEEIVRVDNPHDTFGLTISQGVSVAIFMTSLIAMLVLYRLPLRSPKPGIPRRRQKKQAEPAPEPAG